MVQQPPRYAQAPLSADLDVAEVSELKLVATAAEGVVGVAADQDAVLWVLLV